MSSAPPSLTPLVQQLRDRLYRQWQSGDRVPVETYLSDHPDLQSDVDSALTLVYQEVLLREQCGEKPQLDEYCRRFPQYATRLESLFAVHHALESEQLLGFHVPALTESAATPPVWSGPSAAPLSVPGYEMLEEIGRGGAGIVYKARHTILGRVVALKMLQAGPLASPHELKRFQAEAQSQAKLQHPHIVPIYEVGECVAAGSGLPVPYLVMEYLDGGSLAELIAGKPQPPRQAAQLVEMLARAMQHAHQRGLVHRDLKPGNVLLALSGEPEANAVAPAVASGSPLNEINEYIPKIADFGLAKQLQGAGVSSRSGDIVGTAAYMAPEQARGDKGLTPAVDIYALGVILYEVLTGRPPFLDETALNLLMRMQTEEPVPVRRLQPHVPRDLETICLKCLSKEVTRRYVTAEELADDLGRFLAGEPIRARPVGVWEQGVKWARRRPAVAALLLTLVVVVTGSVFGLSWLWLQAKEHLRNSRISEAEANEQRARADENLQKSRDAEAAALRAQKHLAATTRLAQTYLDQHRYDEALKLLEATLPLQQKQLGLDAPETLVTMYTLGRAYLAKGQHGKAQKVLEQTLHLCQVRLGGDDPGTLRTMTSLALLYLEMDLPEQALPLLEDTLQLRRAKLSAEHPDTLQSMSTLARAYQYVGQFADALRVQQDAVTIARKRLGARNISTLLYLNGLIEVYNRFGRPAEAEPMCRELLNTTREMYGVDSPTYVDFLIQPSLCLLRQKKYTEAEPLLRQCLKVRAQNAPDSWTTFHARSLLGEALLGQGRYDEAEPLLLQGYEGMKQREKAILAIYRYCLIEALGPIVQLYEAWGKPDEAAQWRAKKP